MPNFNKSDYIEECIESILNLSFENWKLHIIDDFSTDGTREMLKNEIKESVNKIIFNEKNYGKGYCIRKGISIAKGDITLIQDADLEYDPTDIPKLINPIQNGNADVVYGSRFLGGTSDGHRVLYFWHRVANAILTLFSNILTDMNLTDMETGYKAFKKDSLKNIILKENRFGFEPEITIKLAKKRLRFFEVSVSYNGRTYEEGKKIGFKDGIRALYCLIKIKFLP